MKTSILICVTGFILIFPKIESPKNYLHKEFNSENKTITYHSLETKNLVDKNNSINRTKAKSDQYVTFYKDEKYGNNHDSYIVGTRMECLPDPPRGVFNQVVGALFHPTTVFNDQISSIKVPNGLKVTCYIDCGFRGTPAARVFTQDCPNVGPEWNDKISSFIIEYNQ